MSKSEIAERVLEVLRASPSPVPAKQLFDSLTQQQIRESEGRKALLDLADRQEVQITSDRRVAVTR